MRELKHIVCIEDEPDIRGLVRIALTTVGNFDVTEYSDGPTALLGLQDKTPDFILLDGMMPSMSGMEVMREIKKRAHLKNTPIAFMTARIRPEEIDEYMALGAAGVIEKPFDPMELSKMVQELWQKTVCKNEGEGQ